MAPPASFRTISPLTLCSFLAAAALFPATPQAQASGDYLGADAVLKKVAGEAEASRQKTVGPQEIRAFLGRIAAFRKTSATLPPKQAAEGWLKLLDQRLEMARSPRAENFFMALPDMRYLMHALPPPEAWDALRTAIGARPPGNDPAGRLALRLLGESLTGDRAAFVKDLDALKKLKESATGHSKSFRSYAFQRFFKAAEESLAATSNDPKAILASLNGTLLSHSASSYPQQLVLPDLVSLVGEKEAESFLRRALKTPNAILEVWKGTETKKLARKLALEMIAEEKLPQWSLAWSLDGAPLYEATEKRFGSAGAKASPGVPSGDIRTAQEYYLLALILQNRPKEAVALAQKLGEHGSFSLPGNSLETLEKAGHAKAVFAFFDELLAQNPDLPFWDEYVRLSAHAGATAKMLERVRASVAGNQPDDDTRMDLNRRLAKALLADDRVEEAVATIRKAVAANDLESLDYVGLSRRADLGFLLARAGLALDRKPLGEEGAKIARQAAERLDVAPLPKDNPNVSHFVDFDLARIFFELGDGPTAETILTGDLAHAVQNAKNPRSRRSHRFVPVPRDTLAALADLYHEAGRDADTAALLDRSPDWNASDVAELYTSEMRTFGQGSRVVPFGYLAASALASTGRKAEAKAILDAVLERDGGFDPAYELLLKLDGPAAMARLDTLFAQDPFEERPLIWKAKLLLDAGKPKEAEAAARKAIAIDPSDGEEGPGDRMRAYAVLADAREALGDKKEAAFFRGAVEAIRLSERADKVYAAGLLSRAVKMYEEALTHFADAYCIQSRLALRLSELGKDKEAEAHYRRAYELMPESFGRVESHCFGCERAFDGEERQSLAEKVFTRLSLKTPDKPQVHYLLGYLREEQQRYGEALVNYRQAVKLDPDYLNAWKHIAQAANYIWTPPKEHDRALFAILRLDPGARHSEHDPLRSASDLRGLWNAVAQAAKKQSAPPTALYPLKASRAEKEIQAEIAKANGDGLQDLYPDLDSQNGPLDPAAILAEQNLVSSLGSLLVTDNP